MNKCLKLKVRHLNKPINADTQKQSLGIVVVTLLHIFLQNYSFIIVKRKRQIKGEKEKK